MSAVSDFEAKLKSFEDKLRTEIPAELHHLIDEVKSVAAKVFGEAEADVADVEQAAVDAAGPVIAQAEAEAGQLAHDAVADAQAAANGSDKPSA
jgi:hypothetical protein